VRLELIIYKNYTEERFFDYKVFSIFCESSKQSYGAGGDLTGPEPRSLSANRAHPDYTT